MYEESITIINVTYLTNKGRYFGKVIDLSNNNTYKIKRDDGVVIEIDRKFVSIINVEVKNNDNRIDFNQFIW